MKRNLVPSYVPHSASGRARLVWYDRTGIRRQKLLPGPFGSPESLAAKARLELELATAPTRTSTVENNITLNEALLAYLQHAEQHYRGPDGKPTSKLCEVKIVVRALRELYGDTPAAGFSPLKLKAVRQVWLTARNVRTEINRRVGMVKRVFKWAVSEELVPASVYQAIATVAGLQRGRTEAKESEPVEPVDDATVDATLPFLNRHVRGLVEFQRLTGCRPGEACAVRRCDIDIGGAVWLYKPVYHKTAWKGKTRTIAIGPRAQALLREFFTPHVNDYLFSPARAVEELNAERAAKRKTPKYPSHIQHNARRRKGTDSERPPAERYNRHSYAHAIDRACDRAFPPPAPLAKRKGESAAKWQARLTADQRDEVKVWQRAHRWAPNQLRHTFATRVRKQHGLEAAQVLLGHARADVTQVYAEKNAALAVLVAGQIG